MVPVGSVVKSPAVWSSFNPAYVYVIELAGVKTSPGIGRASAAGAASPFLIQATAKLSPPPPSFIKAFT